MSEQYQVQIQGQDATIITERVVEQLVQLLFTEDFRNEVKNSVIKELKQDMVGDPTVQEAIAAAIEKGSLCVESRINTAINAKIAEIEAISLSSFQLSLK